MAREQAREQQAREARDNRQERQGSNRQGRHGTSRVQPGVRPNVVPVGRVESRRDTQRATRTREEAP